MTAAMSEKLWKNPLAGDVLTLPDGRRWAVTYVEPPRHHWPGDERVSYDYVNAAGISRKASPMLRDFATRVGALVRDGATYRRGSHVLTAEVPVVDELPDEAAVGDLLAKGSAVFAFTATGWLLVLPASGGEQ